MNCPKCNATVPEDAQFCGVCGFKFEEDQAPTVGSPAGSTAAPTSYGPSTQGLVSGSLSDGWAAFKSSPGVLVGMLIVLMIISGLVEAILKSSLGDSGVYQSFSGLWSLVQNVLAAGFVFSSLKIVRGEDVAFGELFAGFNKFLPIFLAALLVSIAVLVGLVLLVVPGIILALGLSQWMLLIMDRDAGAMDSLKASWEMMRGYKVSLFILGLALIGINLLGALALVVGLLVSLPFSACAGAAFYERVMAQNPPQIGG